MAGSSSSYSTCVSMVQLHSPRVFLNFRGAELRDNFMSHLEKALGEGGIHYFIDKQLVASEDLETLFKEIENSKIALAVFSKRYSESKWCLNELVKIMENVEEKKLRVIPIFFKVTVEDVKYQTGEFGLNLYGGGRRERSNMPEWEKALKSVPAKMGLNSANYSNERHFIEDIVLAVKKVQDIVSPVSGGREITNMLLSTNISSVSCSRSTISRTIEEPIKDLPLHGIEQRLKHLGDMLFDFNWAKSRIVGIVGMPGIGKTTLATKYYKTWNHKFVLHKNILSIRENSISHGTQYWLKNTLLNGQDFNEKADIFSKKILCVLDDVSHKDQVDFLYTKREWIKGGSKIIVTTHDKSSIEELVDDMYVVPCLNDKEALQLFNSHAFSDETSSATGIFPNLSKGFVEYAEGNPRALEELGKEICGKDEDYWERKLETLPYCCNQNILTDLRISYDKLTDQQKDAFLDIACFFRSEQEDYVKCLLDDCESGEAVRDLTKKYLICISAGRIEMHNLLCTFGKELGSSDKNKSGERMWNPDKAIDILCSEHGTNRVRGIFLDTSNVSLGISFDKATFIKTFDHLDLRYLKIYDSHCPQQCDSHEGKVNLPEGLEFPFQEIRYLHWLKFPLDELPQDFNPKNLIDLRLPYSEKLRRVWETDKEAPRLKWVDLSYSTKLTDLSALSKAIDLQRINLQGCTNLSKLPREMKKMKNLVFINLKGCVMLSSLPAKLDLISLKTLILSGCSKFNKFELYAENLEFLHLDGTAIKSLPTTIQNFKKLVLLNLKDCKMLELLPYCLDKLKALEELILSGCVNLKRFPDIRENMENLQILLLDGTSIEKVPNILLHCGKFNDQVVCQQPLRMNGISLLRRLCLSDNHTICSLGSSIGHLYHLKWIDLKNCKKLESISTLPPNLQCLDAHDCISLKSVASPMALLMPTTQQVPSSFIFTNCEKLEYVAKNEIICYAHNKSRLLSEAFNRHNQGFASLALVATSFPGSEIPAWFSHMASGAELEPELPRHWSENGFVGIALCAVVSFKDHKIRNNKLQVKCKCVFNNVETSPSNFECDIGGLSETSDEERTIKSTYVFIGYTNWLNIKTCQEDGSMKGCISTKASIKFEVMDGTKVVTNCEILKCGFSLVYESGSWEASSRTENVRQGESILLGPLRGIKWFFKLFNNGATVTRDDNSNGKLS